MKILLLLLTLGFSMSAFAKDIKISEAEVTKAVFWNFVSGGYDPFYDWQQIKLQMETLEVKRERFTRVEHFGDLYTTRIRAITPIAGKPAQIELHCPVEVFRMNDEAPKSETFYRIGSCMVFNRIDDKVDKNPIYKEPKVIFMGWGKLPNDGNLLLTASEQRSN